MAHSNCYNDNETEEQIAQCIDLLNEVLGDDLLGVYLYGSAVAGGLKAHSDIDIFAVSSRTTTIEEKDKLAKAILKISGVHQKTRKRPIELLIVVKEQVNPWQYPPLFDFQYGDWLRKEFESGNIEPWFSKEMPDLALLITQLLLENKTLSGSSPENLLVNVPYQDVLKAIKGSLHELEENFDDDTRNVLLTHARTWVLLATDLIYSKPDAAQWVIENLPDEHKPIMEKAKAICLGEEVESWGGQLEAAKGCADYMIEKINFLFESNQFSGGEKK